jgi:hypothetical protein
MTPERRHGIFIRIIGLIISCAAAGLFTCTTSLTGGNSSETTNVAVVTDDGFPVASASVKLIDAENWEFRAVNNAGHVLDSAVTGRGGLACFDRLPEVSCNLQIDHAGQGIFIRNFSSKGQITAGIDTVRLQKYATFIGSCVSDSGSPSVVMLEGTAYTSAIAKDRSFHFASVAPGSYPLAFSTAYCNLALAGSTDLAPDQTIARDSIALSFTSLLIDDFESGYSTSVLGHFTRASWYNFADTAEGGTSTVERALKTGAPQGTFTLAATIILRTKPYHTWAGIGIPIGFKKPDWDLSAMTGISFWARGRNTIRISIESPLVDSINNNWPDFYKPITLDSTWRYYRIPVDSLVLPSSKAQTAGITWAMAAKRIYRIEFEGVSTSSTVDTVKLQIDDLRLEGISASDLFMQMESKEPQ